MTSTYNTLRVIDEMMCIEDLENSVRCKVHGVRRAPHIPQVHFKNRASPQGIQGTIALPRLST